jgi:hypothetical protein
MNHSRAWFSTRRHVLSQLSAFAPFAIILLLTLAACGQDTPLTPDALPTAIVVNVNDPAVVVSAAITPVAATPTPDAATLVGLPITPKGVPLPNPSAVATTVGTIVSRDAKLTLPSCAPTNEPSVDLPANFAPNFPFPPGLRPIRAGSLNNNPNYVQVIGYVPLTLQDGVRYVLNEFPKAGYILGRGDSESGEAEATFTGNGWRGGFRMNVLPTCPGMTIWLIVVIKTQS